MDQMYRLLLKNSPKKTQEKMKGHNQISKMTLGSVVPYHFNNFQAVESFLQLHKNNQIETDKNQDIGKYTRNPSILWLHNSEQTIIKYWE